MVGKGSVNHNSRIFNAQNTDPERTHLNTCLCNENIKDVYIELFEDARLKYNEKQKRADRTIDNYYEKIRSSKQEKLFHEIILQIGDKDNPVPGYFTLDRKQFLDAIEKGYVECPSCHKRIQIKRNPSQDFYLWKKWTARTNSENNDWYIEKVPAYSVIDA